MAALSEKILWPIVGIFIFGILAGLYIDDRRNMMQEDSSKASNQQANTQESAEKKASESSTPSSYKKTPVKQAAKTASSKQPHKATSMSMDEYLADSTNKRSEQLEANVKHHQGFSGSIDDYLHSDHSTQVAKNDTGKDTKSTKHHNEKYHSKQASGATSMSMEEYLADSTNKRSEQLEANVKHHQGFSGSIDDYLHSDHSTQVVKNDTGKDAKSTKHENEKYHSKQASGATSMSMEEYLAKFEKGSHGNTSESDSYQGGIDDYLAKYGDGAQTPVKQQNSAPFNKKEHMGFHGSYEEYAKKYN